MKKNPITARYRKAIAAFLAPVVPLVIAAWGKADGEVDFVYAGITQTEVRDIAIAMVVSALAVAGISNAPKYKQIRSSHPEGQHEVYPPIEETGTI